MVIRWTGAELWCLAFFKNLVLIAAFLGSGLGMALGPRRPRVAWGALPLLIVFAAGLPWFTASGIPDGFRFGGEQDFFFQLSAPSAGTHTWEFLVFFVTAFLLSFLLFVALVVLVGREFIGLPPLSAYILNLTGSLVGVVAFALVSYLCTGPMVWFAIGGIALSLAAIPRRAMVALSLATTAICLFLIHTLSEPAIWSPYNRLSVRKWQAQGGQGERGYELSCNRAYHMTIADLRSPLPTDPWFQRAANHYDTPYKFVVPQRVLVLGAGGGNDVAAASQDIAPMLLSVQAMRAAIGDDPVDVPTDDWPQLYIRSRAIPPAQLFLVGVLLLLSLAMTRAFSPLCGRLDLHPALLGAGFLLIETKGIADLGLLFGGTWWTVTVVVAESAPFRLLNLPRAGTARE